MKKRIAVMLAVLMFALTAAAENAVPELTEAAEKLAGGITIERVFFTNGFGFSLSQFETTDQEEIDSLWNAVNRITVKGPVDESVTDWYPMIIFYLSDGSMTAVSFETHWLCVDGKNYELENDEEFWDLTASLVEKYAGTEAGGPVDGGWGVAGDSSITEEIRALFDQATKGIVGVVYEPVAYLGCQVVAGYGHAVLCRATTVYPDAAPRWTIMYLFESLDGDVSITNIADLVW